MASRSSVENDERQPLWLALRPQLRDPSHLTQRSSSATRMIRRMRPTTPMPMYIGDSFGTVGPHYPTTPDENLTVCSRRSSVMFEGGMSGERSTIGVAEESAAIRRTGGLPRDGRR